MGDIDLVSPTTDAQWVVSITPLHGGDWLHIARCLIGTVENTPLTPGQIRAGGESCWVVNGEGV